MVTKHLQPSFLCLSHLFSLFFNTQFVTSFDQNYGRLRKYHNLSRHLSLSIPVIASFNQLLLFIPDPSTPTFLQICQVPIHEEPSLENACSPRGDFVTRNWIFYQSRQRLAMHRFEIGYGKWELYCYLIFLNHFLVLHIEISCSFSMIFIQNCYHF